MIDPEILTLLKQEIAHAMSELRSTVLDGATHDDAVIVADDLSKPVLDEVSQIDNEGFVLDSGMCGAFAFEGGKIKVGGIYRARKFKRLLGIDVPADFTGYAYVEVQMANSETQDAVKLAEEMPELSDKVSIMMLYKFKDGAVEEDYRGSPHVQMWEEAR